MLRIAKPEDARPSMLRLKVPHGLLENWSLDSSTWLEESLCASYAMPLRTGARQQVDDNELSEVG